MEDKEALTRVKFYGIEVTYYRKYDVLDTSGIPWGTPNSTCPRQQGTSICCIAVTYMIFQGLYFS